jgi:3-polyprenyl-4-hydroxybenzoate decarboxylase
VIRLDRWYLRSPLAALISKERGWLLALPERAPTPLTIDEGRLAARLFAHLCRPTPGDRVMAIFGGEADGAAPLTRKLLDRLALLEGGEDQLRALCGGRQTDAKRPCAHLVLGISGSVAALDMTPIVRTLHRSFADRIDVILTRSAQKFVPADALRSMGVDVSTGVFDARSKRRVPHMELAREATIVLVMPASARTIARLANGACSDLLSLVCTATKAPVVVVPAMNARMWRHPAVARNVAQLREDGAIVVEPSIGVEVSEGQNAEPEQGGMGLNMFNVEAALSALLNEEASV